MPKLGAAAGLLALALAGCGGAPSGNNAAAPSQDPRGTANMMMHDAGDPAPSLAPSDAPAARAPAQAPRERFIVCPGNPRCPPSEGNRPDSGN